MNQKHPLPAHALDDKEDSSHSAQGSASNTGIPYGSGISSGGASPGLAATSNIASCVDDK